MTSGIDRRAFLQSVSIAALSTMLTKELSATTPTMTRLPGFSKRSIINVNFIDYIYDYQFINHLLVGGFGVSPTTGFGTGGPVWNKSILDSRGWPILRTTGKSWGNHFLVPSSEVCSSYVIAWEGQGELQLIVGKWTVTGGANFAVVGNGRYTGTNARIQVTYSGPRQQVGWRVLQTNQTGRGYFRNLGFFAPRTKPT